MSEFCGPWPIDPNCNHGIPVDPDLQTDAQRSAVLAASQALWALSGRQFGTCSVTVRPCRTGCLAASPYQAAKAAALIPFGSVLVLPVACGCPGSCGCGPVCEFQLPGPAVEVTSIVIDGETLPPADYLMYEDGRVVHSPGGCWPCCQDLSLPAGVTGTWTVTFVQGEPVPALGQRALAALAAEILSSCDDGKGSICKLPSRVTQITREGVAIDLDTTSTLDDGFTGLPEVDLFIQAFNPGKLSRPSRVWPSARTKHRVQVQP